MLALSCCTRHDSTSNKPAFQVDRLDGKVTVTIFGNTLSSLWRFICGPILIQLTLVISKSKGPSETLRDIRTSTHQIWRTEENTNGQPNFTNEHVI